MTDEKWWLSTITFYLSLFSGMVVFLTLFVVTAAYYEGGINKVRAVLLSAENEYSSLEYFALILGIVVGMGVGAYLWKYVVVEYGWLTRWEVNEMT